MTCYVLTLRQWRKSTKRQKIKYIRSTNFRHLRMRLMLKHFFRHQFRRRLKPFYLCIDWQVDDLRLVLLVYDNLGHKACKKTFLSVGTMSLPMILGSNGTVIHPVWQSFITQLVGAASVHINVGIPNKLCTWLYCPKAPTARSKFFFTLQLYYQRMAATALSIESVNLPVCHLELSSNLSFLAVTKRRYDEQISQLLGLFIMVLKVMWPLVHSLKA